MPKVTIVTVEGEVGELREIVQGLLGAGSGQHVGFDTTVSTPHMPKEDEEMWTPSELRKLWEVVSPGVHPIWAEVATRPSGYPIDELRQKLNLPGAVMSGQLTAVGKALRRMKWAKSDPMRRDLRARTYSMTPEVADVIRELAQEEHLRSQ